MSASVNRKRRTEALRFINKVDKVEIINGVELSTGVTLDTVRFV